MPLSGGSVAGVLVDPPYSEHYARELYGVDYPLPAHLLKEAARVVRPGGGASGSCITSSRILRPRATT